MQYTKNYHLPIFALHDMSNLTALNAGFISLDNSVKDAVDSADQAAGIVSEQLDNIAALQSDVAKAKKDIINLHTTQVVHGQDIDSNNLDIAKNAAAIAVNKNDIGNLTATLQEVQQAVGKLQWSSLATVSLVSDAFANATLSARILSDVAIEVYMYADVTKEITDITPIVTVELPDNLKMGNAQCVAYPGGFLTVATSGLQIMIKPTDTVPAGGHIQWRAAFTLIRGV